MVGRIFPCPLRRPQNILTMPVVGEFLPTLRPGLIHGDPRPWIPGAFQLGAAQGAQEPMPWSEGCDMLLAPFPASGVETETLLRILRDLSADFQVALYERDVPLWPNLLLQGEAHADTLHFADAAAGLRAYRSAFRHLGRGFSEAFLLEPAGRLSQLLRASWRAEFRPNRQDPYQYRHHLATALDYQRSLLELQQHPSTQLRPKARIVVVMPHFDDEVLQCGAAILQAVAAGSEVRVIWLTDGRMGVSSVSEEESARIRHQEAQQAMEILGVEDLHFLDAPETRLQVRGTWTAELRSLLEEFHPDRVHTVWWADNNLDHFEANRVLFAAWPKSLMDCEIAASGLWQPLPLTSGLGFDAGVRAKKDEAIQAYASQLKEVDYLRVDHGLAHWYAREDQASWKEAFWILPAQKYWQALTRTGVGKRLFL